MKAVIRRLEKVFQPFVDKRPVGVMARGIRERLFDPARLDARFDQHAELGYTQKLHFSTLVALMGDVVLGVRPSVHAAFQNLEAKTVLILADLDRKRWTIETVFPEITATLPRAMQTLGDPKAALVAFCLALVAFHAVSRLKASLRAVHGETTVTDLVSGSALNLEIRATDDGMMVALPEPHWRLVRTLSVAAMAQVLQELAGHRTLARDRKHPRGPKKPPPKKAAYANGGHVSTFRLLHRNE